MAAVTLDSESLNIVAEHWTVEDLNGMKQSQLMEMYLASPCPDRGAHMQVSISRTGKGSEDSKDDLPITKHMQRRSHLSFHW